MTTRVQTLPIWKWLVVQHWFVSATFHRKGFQKSSKMQLITRTNSLIGLKTQNRLVLQTPHSALLIWLKLTLLANSKETNP